MARKRRVWYPGAIYHVMARGVRRLPIFRDEEDRFIFMMKIKYAQKRYPFILHAFCLMTNHVHLLIETKDVEIGKIMRYLLGGYAMDYNQKYMLKGHLFEERYTSRLIEDPVYFLEVSRYIHLNPVKAEMVKYPADYRFSSYSTYVGGKRYRFVETSRILGYFDRNPACQYKEYVERLVSHEEHEMQIRIDMREDENWMPIARGE